MSKKQDKIKLYKQRIENLKLDLEVWQARAKYYEGAVEGLKYAARCNGVSGAEVKV